MEFKEGTLSFTVGSKALKTEIEDEERNLTKLFKAQGFKAPIIKVDLDVKKVKEYKPFTAREQFLAASKEYPILKDFADRFGLDFDV